MKKSMRMAALLLAGSLATTAFVGGTFAKYVTSANGTDSARVAKWGITVTVDSNNADFKKEYATEDNSVKASITNSVVSTVNVVAPGTSGTLTDATISGTPEVAVNVAYTADLSLTNWTIDTDTEYCPIVFTVEGNTYAMGETYKTISALETAVEGAIAACTKNYAANTNFATSLSTDAPSVSWAWDINSDNTNDTKLGDKAAKATQDTDAPSISLKLTTTVTQID